MADALFSASFLNACMRHAGDVGMANIAPIVNTRGPLYVHAAGIVRRTTFHILAMYANLLGERIAAAKLTGPPLLHDGRSISALDALATCDRSGTNWRIVLINRRPHEALPCTVRIGARPIEGRLRATLLDGDSPEAFNSVDRPDRVVPRVAELVFTGGGVVLPPHSVSIVEIRAGR
jgi:alpha-N-arabinofuranosidase